jgi:hypothetical protein
MIKSIIKRIDDVLNLPRTGWPMKAKGDRYVYYKSFIMDVRTEIQKVQYHVLFLGHRSAKRKKTYPDYLIFC